MSIEIAKSARVSRLADIEPSSKGAKVVIRDEAVVDSFVKIHRLPEDGDVVIGARSVVSSGCVINAGGGLSIGEDVLVCANCTFAPNVRSQPQLSVEESAPTAEGLRSGSSSPMSGASAEPWRSVKPVNDSTPNRASAAEGGPEGTEARVERSTPSKRKGIIVEDAVHIGANCVIFDGAVLRKNCVVVSGSVVVGELAPGSVNAGFPARPAHEERGTEGGSDVDSIKYEM